MQSTKLYRENHENQHQQPKSSASDPGSIISKKLLLYKDARVHYVVLKQQPHHTLPEQQQTLTEHPPKPFSRLCAGNQKSTTLVVVSGPNSVPNT
jgi:hypothetical protein